MHGLENSLNGDAKVRKTNATAHGIKFKHWFDQTTSSGLGGQGPNGQTNIIFDVNNTILHLDYILTPAKLRGETKISIRSFERVYITNVVSLFITYNQR